MAPNVALPTATPTLGPTRLLDFLHVPRLEDKISPNANDPRKETASGMVFLGICLCITFALAAPMIGIWLADRIKRRKLDPFKKLRDLERKRRRPGIDPPPYKKTPPKDSIWARQERYKTKKPPRAITSDQVLGIDKTSYLQRIVPQSGSWAVYSILERLLIGSNRRIIAATYSRACAHRMGQAKGYVGRGRRAVYQPVGCRTYSESGYFPMASTETAVRRQHQWQKLRKIASDDNVQYFITTDSCLASGRLQTCPYRESFP
jgi:hypothetical protein